MPRITRVTSIEHMAPDLQNEKIGKWASVTIHSTAALRLVGATRFVEPQLRLSPSFLR